MTVVGATIVACGVVATTGIEQAGTAPDGARVDFNRDIRPILSDRCFKCHGPDRDARKARLRLDTETGSTADRGGAAAIVPGNPEASLVVQRLASPDPDERMPPPESELHVSEEEAALIERWIAEGASYADHWAFKQPSRLAAPQVRDESWARNDIDLFILAALEQEGLRPAPEADRATLLRRLSFDLTGLPPTPEDIDAFAADESPDAWERVVDRMLDSPHYGERMAMLWLDVARYADTHGYHHDDERVMWPWRDWVIRAFNENVPYNDFILEQVAGDLLDNPTLDQRIATGFNRNHPITFEGGVISEEYRVEYVADRVTTTATAFLGLTMDCARCHDHKYDPISQEEYYRFYAFFNSTDEKGLDTRGPVTNPIIRAPTEEQQARIDAIAARLAETEAALEARLGDVNDQQKTWQEAMGVRWTQLIPSDASTVHGSPVEILADGAVSHANFPNPAREIYEVAARTDEIGLTTVRLDFLQVPEIDGKLGQSPNGNVVMTGLELVATSVAEPAQSQTLSFVRAWADVEQDNGPFVASNVLDNDPATGWAFAGHLKPGNRVGLFVTDRPFGYAGGTDLHLRIRFESIYSQHVAKRFRIFVTSTDVGAMLEQTVPGSLVLNPWSLAGPFQAASGNEAFETAFSPELSIDLEATNEDGKPIWTARPGFEDGRPHRLDGERSAFYLHREITSPDHRQIELSLGSDDAIKVWINGGEVLANNARRGVAPDQERITIDLNEGANTVLLKIVNDGGPAGFYFRSEGPSQDALPYLTPLALLPPEDLDEVQTERLRDAYRLSESEVYRDGIDSIRQVRDELAEAERDAPLVMVMGDLATPRATYVLTRGAYNNPDMSRPVEPGIPAALGGLPEGFPANRLGLAQWLIDDDRNPLTVRVGVNRFWQMIFGTGIVATSENFGSQAAWPSHPELLDWLAHEFVDSGWDVKALLRLIVTSATYRQSSVLTFELHERDPMNRLLARSPRRRLPAEMVRDQALAVSGLYVDTVGGPSVKPYQPPGLWIERAIPGSLTRNFVRGDGDDLYRRSMYTFWKRSAPPPQMAIFDAPEREYCVVQRPTTSTPLQALVLMNDETYLEAARVLAQRVMLEESGSRTRIARAFRLATGRTPESFEIDLLQERFEHALVRYTDAPDDALALLEHGEAPVDPGLEPAELAAYSIIAGIILNLDETITRD